jgi:hypothetical protein
MCAEPTPRRWLVMLCGALQDLPGIDNPAHGGAGVESASILAAPHAATTQESVIARVMRDADRAYGDTISAETLADWVSVEVRELWGDSVKVTSFLPVLAMRRINTRASKLVGPNAR